MRYRTFSIERCIHWNDVHQINGVFFHETLTVLLQYFAPFGQILVVFLLRLLYPPWVQKYKLMILRWNVVFSWVLCGGLFVLESSSRDGVTGLRLLRMSNYISLMSFSISSCIFCCDIILILKIGEGQSTILLCKVIVYLFCASNFMYISFRVFLVRGLAW